MTKKQFIEMAEERKSKIKEMLMMDGDGIDTRHKIAEVATGPIYHLLVDEKLAFFDPLTLDWQILINDIYLQLILDMDNNGVERVERCQDNNGNEYWFSVKINNFEDFYDMIH